MAGMRGDQFLVLLSLLGCTFFYAPTAQAYDETPANDRQSRLDSLISTVSNEIDKKTDDLNRLNDQLQKQTYALDSIQQSTISARTGLITARDRIKQLKINLKELTKRLAAELDQSEDSTAADAAHEQATQQSQSAQHAALEPLRQTISYRSAKDLHKNARDRLNKLQTTPGISNSSLLSAAKSLDKSKQIVDMMEKTTLDNSPEYLAAQENLNQAAAALAARKATNRKAIEKNDERLAMLTQLENATPDIKANMKLVAACARRASAAEYEVLKTKSEISRLRNDGQRLENIRSRWEHIKRKNQDRNR